MQESYHYMKYKRSENSLYIYADDIVPRHITCSLLMDYDTMAGGDKFGNLFMTRLPADTSNQVHGVAYPRLCSAGDC
jgi:splicing factor 3B subunit 3